MSEKIAIMAALKEEIESLLATIQVRHTYEHGRRIFYEGDLFGQPVLLVFSRWGKVAAAATATELIARFGATRILFFGVAGALHSELKIGDIVIGNSLVQHDLDARPIFQQFEIPLLGKTTLPTHEEDTTRLAEAAQQFLASQFANKITPEAQAEFNIHTPQVLVGEIATGDRFFADAKSTATLRKARPDALCVEMEGASVAQVCAEYEIPFAIMRTISDNANEHASINFPRFTKKVASLYSFCVARNWLSSYHASHLSY